jgi:hypothetical protein
MNTTPRLPGIGTQLIQAMQHVERAMEVVQSHYEVFQALARENAYVEYTSDGLVIHEADVRKLILALEEKYAIVFSRRLNDAGSYDWVTDFFGVNLILPAVEVIDHTGTLVTTNTEPRP